MPPGFSRPAARGSLRILLLLALVLATSRAAAVDLPGVTSATLGWTQASGSVAGYSVFVARNGVTPTQPEQQVASLSAKISGAVGESLVVWVRAYDAAGTLGPASVSSDTLRFVAAPVLPPLAAVAPANLTVSAVQASSPASTSITIRNAGTGTLSYTVTANASWVVPTPASGTATTETDSIALAFAASGLAVGSYNASITVKNSGTGATSTVPITLTVTPGAPILLVAPMSLSATVSAGKNATGLTLAVRNTGTGLLSYTLSEGSSWLSLASSGGGSTGEIDSIAIVFNTSTLAPGTYTANVTVSAPGAGGAPRTVPVSLVVTPAASMQASVASVSAAVAHGHAARDQMLTVRNAGPGNVSYTLMGDASWLSPSPTSGSSGGESDAITLHFNTNGLPPGEHRTNLRVSSPGATPVLVPVTVHVRPPTGDLDGDGSSESLLLNETGYILAWSHVLSAESSVSFINGGAPAGWQLLVSGDFDGDGTSDLLWRNRTSGSTGVCLMQGSAILGCGAPLATHASWMLLGTADFNGDGRSDVAYRDTQNGAVQACFMNGLAAALCAQIASYPLSWPVQVVNDGDGDGFAELVAQNPADTVLALCHVAGAAAGACSAPQALVGAEIVATGDYDGDGEADLLWLQRSNGRLTLGFPDLVGWPAFRTLGTISPNAELVGTSDYDGDGKSEISIRNVTTGAVSIWTLDATGLAQQTQLGALGTAFTLGGSDPTQ